nr:uncharacterized protein LOC123768795 [Procambarus clarkii]
MVTITTIVSHSPHQSHPRPTYHPHLAIYPRPIYHPQPHFTRHQYTVPSCAVNTTKTWCLEDANYPTDDVQQAIQKHHYVFTTLYADVGTLTTEHSVGRPKTLQEEMYLCPSDTAYVKPLRVQNNEGKWRVIVNNVKVNYETYTQTARVEECLTAGENCQIVPLCYEFKCLQKSIYHRFLVYDPYDQYFPFAIETFKLPASCDCLLMRG